MANTITWTCDICGKEINQVKEELFQVTLQSDSFKNGTGDLRDIHVYGEFCETCARNVFNAIEKFFPKLKEERK